MIRPEITVTIRQMGVNGWEYVCEGTQGPGTNFSAGEFMSIKELCEDLGEQLEGMTAIPDLNNHEWLVLFVKRVLRV